MKTIITITALFILILSFASCSTDQMPVAPEGTPVAVIDKDGLTGSGATVVRFEGHIGITYVDVDRQLRLVLGVDMDLFCIGEGEFDFIDIMEVTNPVDQDLVMQLFKGDINAFVYPLYPWDCARFVAEGPIGSGIVKVISTDNDLYAYLATNTANRVNSFGIKANGALFAPDGQMILLNFINRVVWNGYPAIDYILTLGSDIRLAYAASPRLQ